MYLNLLQRNPNLSFHLIFLLLFQIHSLKVFCVVLAVICTQCSTLRSSQNDAVTTNRCEKTKQVIKKAKRALKSDARLVYANIKSNKDLSSIGNLKVCTFSYCMLKSNLVFFRHFQHMIIINDVLLFCRNIQAKWMRKCWIYGTVLNHVVFFV